MIAAVGASGRFDEDGKKIVYRGSMKLIGSAKVQVLPLLTHYHGTLEEVPMAFERDFDRSDYTKGVVKMR
jgi:threonine dehydrogenase-like Zn-dependent dehydrogenase